MLVLALPSRLRAIDVSYHDLESRTFLTSSQTQSLKFEPFIVLREHAVSRRASAGFDFEQKRPSGAAMSRPAAGGEESSEVLK